MGSPNYLSSDPITVILISKEENDEKEMGAGSPTSCSRDSWRRLLTGNSFGAPRPFARSIFCQTADELEISVSASGDRPGLQKRAGYHGVLRVAAAPLERPSRTPARAVPVGVSVAVKTRRR